MKINLPPKLEDSIRAKIIDHTFNLYSNDDFDVQLELPSLRDAFITKSHMKCLKLKHVLS